jgi:hypothetical protein
LILLPNSLEELLLVAGTLPWIRTNDPHWWVCCFCTSDHHRPGAIFSDIW